MRERVHTHIIYIMFPFSFDALWQGRVQLECIERAFIGTGSSTQELLYGRRVNRGSLGVMQQYVHIGREGGTEQRSGGMIPKALSLSLCTPKLNRRISFESQSVALSKQELQRVYYSGKIPFFSCQMNMILNLFNMSL